MNGARSHLPVVSNFRNQVAIVDTPMRKIELLETHEGRLLVRATEYTAQQAYVIPIWLEHPEAIALAETIYELEPPVEAAALKDQKDIVMITGGVKRTGDYLECAVCGDIFKVHHPKRWVRDLDRAVEHCKKYHPKTDVAKGTLSLQQK